MATKRRGARRSPEKEARWRKVIAQWRGSGQTLKEFVTERDLKYWTVRWWATELKKRDAERNKGAVIPEVAPWAMEVAGSAFVPVRVVGSSPRELPRPARSGRDRSFACGNVPGEGAAVSQPSLIEIVPFGQVRIRVPPDFDPRTLRALLDVLEAPC